MKISKNEKMRFFPMSQGSLNPKSKFLGQRMCSVDWERTETQTDRHENEYRGHPFRVSRFFPSTYHQGSVQKNADPKTRPGNIHEIHINQTVKNTSQS